MFARSACVRLAALCLTLAACGGDDDGDPGYAVPDTTVVLDEEALAALDSVSEDLSAFTFARSSPALDRLDEGDIIVAGVHGALLPAGALRRVQRIDRAGGVTLTTTAASLAEAIERGSIRETIQLREDDIVSLRARRGVRREVGPTGLYFGLNDVVLFDGDGGASTSDQVVMNGNIAIEPDLDIVIDIDGFSLEEASVSIGGAVSGSVNIDARRQATLPGTPITLATLHLAPITFFVGPVPVVITTAIDLQVGVSGVVTARMNVGFQTDAEARIGFGYIDGSLGPIGEIDPSASLELQSFEDGVVGTARLFAGPRLRVGLYGIDVGFARLSAYVQADVDASADPWWCLSAGFEGSAGLDISLDIDFWIFDITIELVDYETPPLGDSVALGCAEGPAPSSMPGGGGEEAIQTFARSFGGENLDTINAVLATGDGGAILAGATNSFSGSPGDAWLVKVDALGHISWQLAYEDLDAATDVIDMGEGYLVTAGNVGATVDRLHLLRVDDNGGVRWAASYADDPRGVGPSRAVRAQDGGFLVAGTRDVTTSADFYAARFDVDGELVWARTYGGPEDDEAYAAVATSDGGFLLVGETESFGVTFQATWVVKIDAGGDVEWQELFDTGGNFLGYVAVESPLGGYLVGGHEFGRGLLIRLGAAGEVTWSRAIDAGSDNDYLMSAAAYPDGSFAALGSTGLGADSDLWALRVSDDGNVLWSRVIGGSDGEAAGGMPPYDRAGQPVAVASDGGLLVAARTSTFSAGYDDAWLLKLSSNGFIDMDPASGATSAALGGDITTLTMVAAPTGVTAEPLALTRSDLEPTLLSTEATSARQAGLP